MSELALITPPATKPLVQLRPHQLGPFWRDDLGLTYLSWRRRGGKSHLMASKALYRGMKRRGLLSVFISASIILGAEFVRKEAQVWNDVTEKMKALANSSGQLITSNGDGLALDDVCELFEGGKLETKIWHDRTTCSRSLVVAPNERAVGYGGDVYFDEVGRMPNFKELIEAAEPILQDDPTLRWMMATTVAPDDEHYSRELSLPPEGGDQVFPADPAGNWYVSQLGVTVHRFDVDDGEAGGMRMFDRNTRQPITAEEHRAQAFDRAAWDRNYRLKFTAGGASAVDLAQLDLAMRRGGDLGAVFVDCQEAIEL